VASKFEWPRDELVHFAGLFHNFSMFFVYVLENESNKSLYIGFTRDLKRRLFEHQNNKGGKTTKTERSWKLIYYEAYFTEKDALGREKFLKGGSGRKYLKKQLKYYWNKPT